MTHIWNQWISFIFEFVARAIDYKKEEKKIIKFDIHITILTILAPGVIFCPSQAGQMEDQPGICILLSYIMALKCIF